MTMFVRLFLLIGSVSGVALSLVAGLLWHSSLELERQLRIENSAVGQRVLSSGTRLLEDDLRSTHQTIVREKARTVEAYFSEIAAAVQLQSLLVSQFLTDDGALQNAPPLFPANDVTHRARGNPASNKTFFGVRPYTIFHLAPDENLSQSNTSMQRLRRLGVFFSHTHNTLTGSDSVYYGSEQGFILGYPGAKTFFKPAYDPRRRDWYRSAMARGKSTWIVNLDRDNKSFLVTCANPVRLPGRAAPVGVAAIDVRWPNVLKELFDVGDLKVSKTILVDETNRVRVSASYDKTRLKFDERDAFETPLISELPERGFAAALAQIRAVPKQDFSIYWAGKTMMQAKSVFIIAKVRLSTIGRATDSKSSIPSAATVDNWHYIVQFPVDSLLKPVRAVTGEINNSTQDIAQAIEVRTRQSAAVVLGVIGATMLVALAIAYVAARATSRPLIQMARVARGIGAGDLDQQAPETSGGEIGELGRSLNVMISGLKQRNLLKETFGRYVAPSVVDQVLRQGDVQMGGSRKVVTIFFSDLQGFTAMSETISPEELVALLNEYLDAMTKVVLDLEGTLDKYIGDAILAFWGEPLPHEDDAARACRAALQQSAQLEILGRKWASEGRPILKMRIGIETGEVIIGNVGSQLKLNYTVLGDTVNFASRLEGVNKVYGTRILIGEQTRQMAANAIEVREIDRLAVMGKSNSVCVYELLGMKGDISSQRRAGYDAYERGLQEYREQNWSQAKGHLEAAQAILGADKPSQILLSRIEKFRVNAPPADWDGTAVLDSK